MDCYILSFFSWYCADVISNDMLLMQMFPVNSWNTSTSAWNLYTPEAQDWQEMYCRFVATICWWICNIHYYCQKRFVTSCNSKHLQSTHTPFQYSYNMFKHIKGNSLSRKTWSFWIWGNSFIFKIFLPSVRALQLGETVAVMQLVPKTVFMWKSVWGPYCLIRPRPVIRTGYRLKEDI